MQTGSAGLEDEIRIAQDASACTQHSGGSGPSQQAQKQECGDHGGEWRHVQRQHGPHGEHQEQPWQREHQVSDCEGKALAPTAKVTGNDADKRCHEGREEGCCGREQQRNSGAIEHARQAIAS